MKALKILLLTFVMFGLCSLTSAADFEEDFESYAVGSQIHGQGGWAGWDGAISAGAPVSDAFAYSGTKSIEIVPTADLVHQFDAVGGRWIYTTMMYIPSGGSGTTWFIMLNTYTEGGDPKDWSIQTQFNQDNGQITSSYVGGTFDIIYDQWVELKMDIDLDNDTVDEYYNGQLIYTHEWDDNDHGTLQCVDLYGADSSSVYYDDIMLVDTRSLAGNPYPADGSSDAARDALLTWSPGSHAVTHDIYFGTDYDTVASASRTTPMGVLVSQGQSGTSYEVDEFLELEAVYYWRIDEIRQDGTIDKGLVWSFTTEPLLYTMENIIATSNGVLLAGQGPENTVNGSGLNEDGQHSTETGDMWLTPFGDEPLTIQFEFPIPAELHAMQVWNHNFIFEMALGLGAKDVTVDYSLDGDTWTTLTDTVLGRGTGMANYTANTTVDFGGVPAKFVKLTINSSYSGGPQVGLSEVQFLYLPVMARYPLPADGATNVAVDTLLRWRPSRGAVSNDLYMGTDPDALELAATTTDGRYTPGELDLAATYYWQVNEVNEADTISVWEGDLWSFTTQEYVVVEDFESYDDDIDAGTTIWQSWIDGLDDPTNGGAVVGYGQSPFAELTTVHGGAQAMPFFFTNESASTISEADRAFTGGQNWTANGIKSLSLWFNGHPDNTGGQLYFKINNVKIAYDGAASDIRAGLWQPWNIDLTAVTTNVSNVTSMTFGVEGIGSGAIYVDDIRLYGNATELVVPTQPDEANLVARYAFEGNLNDSTGAHPGVVMGDAVTTNDAARGQVLSLDGAGDAVNVAYSEALNPEVFSASLWAYADPAGSNYRSPLTSRDDAPQRGYIIYINPSNAWQFWIGTGSGWSSAIGPDAQFGEWTHVGISYADAVKKLYINGLLAAQNTATISLNNQRPLRIGGGATESATGNYFFQGMIDEVQIYNVELSPAEMAGLAGRTAPLYTAF